MEITCNRCHQAVPQESTYCPACGLPQLVYSTDGSDGPAEAERWTQAVRDASQVEWRPALRLAMLLALPAALLFCTLAPAIIPSFFWMGAISAIVVALYSRNRRPAWITLGAGARIGLITGMMTGWTVFAISAATLFALRNMFHQGPALDAWWHKFISEKLNPQWQAAGYGAQDIATFNSFFLSFEGRAAIMLGILAFFESLLLLSSAAGGALGAGMLIRRDRQ